VLRAMSLIGYIVSLRSPMDTQEIRMTALTQVLKRLGRENFPGSRFTEAREGRTIAEDAVGRLGSVFQPIVDAEGNVVGHHAFLRAADPRGRTLAPGQLFASVRDEGSVERLDWLARALHMVNYFPAVHDRSHLFLSVDARTIASPSDEHRECFDALLTSLDVPTSRCVVDLPECTLDDPVTFVRSTLSYRIRGYRVLSTLRAADAHADLDHVFMADPNYVSIDVSGFAAPAHEGGRERLHRIVQSLRSRGIRTLARQVETPEQARLALDVGFALLQGRYFAPPAPEAPIGTKKRVAATA
jgi:EAL domain-containing protein (putative c-di-GMP-specific phosphodiesterase class I)